MEDYEIIERIGGGAFADVYKAKEKQTGEFVAIKILKKKYKKWEDCLKLRECKSLQKLLDDSLINQKGINNIIKLKRIIFTKKTGLFHLIFEYMDQDLLALMKSREPNHLSESEIRDIIYQTLLGLSHMHKYGFFHRDMKPENLLITDKMVKVADFGLAREIRSIPPYTEYVSTRYYRAPECILKSNNYNSPVDIWAVGCIMAEMYMHPQPLFLGQNEKEVLNKICSILGTPTHDIWPDGIQKAKLIGIKFPNGPGTDLKNVIPNASPKAIDLMKQMLQWDPNNRPTAVSLLNHPFFEKDTENNSNILNISNFFENFEKNSKILTRNDKNKDTEYIKKSVSLQKQSKGDDNSNSSNNNNNGNNNNNNYLKLLNDTDGLSKLLNQLKKDKIQDDKEFEKDINNKFGTNDSDISNINCNGLDITNFSIGKSNNNLFNQSLKINNISTKNKNNNNDNSIADVDFSYNVSTLGNNTLKNSIIQENKKEEKNEKFFNEYIETNNSNYKENEDQNILKIDDNNNNNNNFDFNLEFAPKKKTNRLRSAKKFLEENESKFKCDQKLNEQIESLYKNKIPNKNHLFVKHKSEKIINFNLEDNDFFNVDNNNFEAKDKKNNEIVSDYMKKDYNYMNGNSKGLEFFNEQESLFKCSRRNHLPNNNNIWGIK